MSKHIEALKAIASAHTNADMYTREYIIATFINPARAALVEGPAQTATYTCGVCGVSMQMEKPVQPSKQWVWLTDKELDDLWVLHHDHLGQPKTSAQNGWAFERAIEAKLKEKNA